MKRLDNATIEALSGELNPHHTKQTKGKRSNHGRRAARMAGAGLPYSLPCVVVKAVAAVPESLAGQRLAVPVTGLEEATPRLRRGGLTELCSSDAPVMGLYAGGIGSVAGLAGGPSGVIAGPYSWLPEVA